MFNFNPARRAGDMGCSTYMRFAHLVVAKCAVMGHPFVPMFGTVPFSPASENIHCNKATAFPHSGVMFGMQDKPEEFTKTQYGPLPVLGLPVQVQCDGFKCMAFRDREGRWVDLFSRKFMDRVLGVVPA